MHSPVLAIRRSPLVAVYGTLKHGLRNHHWLEGATFVGDDTLGDITLYDLGHCPGAKREPSRGIEVELYRVDARSLRHLDRLEDYRVRAPLTGTYDRVLHDTAFGPAWLYLYNLEVSGCPVIRTGGWPVS